MIAWFFWTIVYTRKYSVQHFAHHGLRQAYKVCMPEKPFNGQILNWIDNCFLLCLIVQRRMKQSFASCHWTFQRKKGIMTTSATYLLTPSTSKVLCIGNLHADLTSKQKKQSGCARLCMSTCSTVITWDTLGQISACTRLIGSWKYVSHTLCKVFRLNPCLLAVERQKHYQIGVIDIVLCTILLDIEALK